MCQWQSKGLWAKWRRSGALQVERLSFLFPWEYLYRLRTLKQFSVLFKRAGVRELGGGVGGGVVWAIRRNHSAVKHWFTGLRDTAELLEEVWRNKCDVKKKTQKFSFSSKKNLKSFNADVADVVLFEDKFEVWCQILVLIASPQILAFIFYGFI